jgi:1-deoxy-D-xylulose-5-phosphate reductoisomerase
MRVPIAYGLAFPERVESGAAALDFTRLAALEFEPADPARYPGLGLAWQALRGPEGTTAVLNAANEVAVAAFLDGALGFDEIHRINEAALAAVAPAAGESDSAEGLIALDARARRHAELSVKESRR